MQGRECNGKRENGDAGRQGRPRGAVRLRLVARGDRVSYADLRGATRCDLVSSARRENELDF